MIALVVLVPVVLFVLWRIVRRRRRPAALLAAIPVLRVDSVDSELRVGRRGRDRQAGRP